VAGTLQAIWEMVLRRRPIGHDDDIFDIGGDSLAVLSILRRVEKTFGISLPITAIFARRTIAALADLIETMERPEFSSLVLQKEGDDRPALYMIHGLGGTVIELVGLGRRIRYGGAVYAVQARGLTGSDPPHARVEDMAREYISTIRSIQPHGPYCLAGHSFGGLVAFEMARSLQCGGEPVGYLGLLDTMLHKRCWSMYTRVDKGLRRAREEIGKLRQRPLKDTVRSALTRRSWGTGAASNCGAGMRQSAMDHFEDLPPALRAVYESAEEAFFHYNPDIMSPWGCDPVLNWRSRCRRLIYITSPACIPAWFSSQEWILLRKPFRLVLPRPCRKPPVTGANKPGRRFNFDLTVGSVHERDNGCKFACEAAA
jgi:thioesterase domain-containing protein